MFKYSRKMTALLLIVILAFTGCATKNTLSTDDAQKKVLDFLNNYLTFTGADKFIDNGDYLNACETVPEAFKPQMTDNCYKDLIADRFLTMPLDFANMFKCNIHVSDIKQKDYRFDEKTMEIVYEHTFNIKFTSINGNGSFSEPTESQIVLTYKDNNWIISNVYIPWPVNDIKNKAKLFQGGDE